MNIPCHVYDDGWQDNSKAVNLVRIVWLEVEEHSLCVKSTCTFVQNKSCACFIIITWYPFYKYVHITRLIVILVYTVLHCQFSLWRFEFLQLVSAYTLSYYTYFNVKDFTFSHAFFFSMVGMRNYEITGYPNTNFRLPIWYIRIKKCSIFLLVDAMTTYYLSVVAYTVVCGRKFQLLPN